MENIKSETIGQKHISTLATDIKHLISEISNGKPANMTEENMDVFLKNIKEAMNEPYYKTGDISIKLYYDKDTYDYFEIGED